MNERKREREQDSVRKNNRNIVICLKKLIFHISHKKANRTLASQIDDLEVDVVFCFSLR